MPTYEYACTGCGHEMETFQRMVEDALTLCPECNNHALKRKIGTGAGIIFKGGGFYETDFKEKKGTKTSDKPVEKAEKSDSKTDSGSDKSAKKEASPTGTGKKSD